MPSTVDFTTVSTVGLELSPVATALAGLRANEARYFKNKYDHVFTVEPASNAKWTIDWVHRILREERGIVISRDHPEGRLCELHGAAGRGRLAGQRDGRPLPQNDQEERECA
jgi:hypothetical protein